MLASLEVCVWQYPWSVAADLAPLVWSALLPPPPLLFLLFFAPFEPLGKDNRPLDNLKCLFCTSTRRTDKEAYEASTIFNTPLEKGICSQWGGSWGEVRGAEAVPVKLDRAQRFGQTMAHSISVGTTTYPNRTKLGLDQKSRALFLQDKWQWLWPPNFRLVSFRISIMAEEEAAEVEGVNDAGGSAYALMTDAWPTCAKVSIIISIIIMVNEWVMGEVDIYALMADAWPTCVKVSPSFQQENVTKCCEEIFTLTFGNIRCIIIHGLIASLNTYIWSKIGWG